MTSQFKDGSRNMEQWKNTNFQGFIESPLPLFQKKASLECGGGLQSQFYAQNSTPLKVRYSQRLDNLLNQDMSSAAAKQHPNTFNFD